ncbi:unnamed protein product [Thelazia callipaeda]|uniref:EGF_2 domain-containing protein n=1 Tax=Thelazia callipaeda TaxID=103827 RepID=A0A0N5CZW6_THECL|nr:unnamed protein product [Thelazia callipaeda]
MSVSFKHLHWKYVMDGFELRFSNLQPEDLEVTFEIMCEGELIQGTRCKNVPMGSVVEFYAIFHLRSCSASENIPVAIGVYGYEEIVAAVYITPFCSCECEKITNHIEAASQCSNNGKLVCGSCECNKGMGGKHCDCDLAYYNVSSTSELEAQCKRNADDEEVCSGKGHCQCNKCECFPGQANGKYCECNAEDGYCPKANGVECSSHGKCVCGVCECREGYSGEDCSCHAGDRHCPEYTVNPEEIQSSLEEEGEDKVDETVLESSNEAIASISDGQEINKDDQSVTQGEKIASEMATAGGLTLTLYQLFPFLLFLILF